mmetsp:Transcript_36107/g.93096  ORF Transcript_36107/g.93096 Transcript_36107/m.93096 type:complete len:397 (-) Transcript_36107:771-1961(-)
MPQTSLVRRRHRGAFAVAAGAAAALACRVAHGLWSHRDRGVQREDAGRWLWPSANGHAAVDCQRHLGRVDVARRLQDGLAGRAAEQEECRWLHLAPLALQAADGGRAVDPAGRLGHGVHGPAGLRLVGPGDNLLPERAVEAAGLDRRLAGDGVPGLPARRHGSRGDDPRDLPAGEGPLVLRRQRDLAVRAGCTAGEPVRVARPETRSPGKGAQPGRELAWHGQGLGGQHEERRRGDPASVSWAAGVGAPAHPAGAEHQDRRRPAPRGGRPGGGGRAGAGVCVPEVGAAVPGHRAAPFADAWRRQPGGRSYRSTVDEHFSRSDRQQRRSHGRKWCSFLRPVCQRHRRRRRPPPGRRGREAALPQRAVLHEPLDTAALRTAERSPGGHGRQGDRGQEG